MISVDFTANFPFAEYKYKCQILWKCANKNSKTLSLKSSSLCGHFLDARMDVNILCNGWEHYVPYRCL
jgi:hypothetical protein